MESQKILVRKEARESIKLLLSQYPETNNVFWRKIYDEVERILVNNDPTFQKANIIKTILNPPKMSQQESIEFDKVPCPMRKFAGRPTGEVPISYLLLISEPTEYQRQLRRYLNSDRISKQIEAGAE